MVLLTDSQFETVKIRQGRSAVRKIVPLYHCQWEEWLFVIISSCLQLPECQWVGCPRVTIEGDDVCREWDSNKTIDYLVEKAQSWVSTPLFESAPAQFSQHVSNTRVWRVITQDPSSRPTLDHLDPLDIFLDIRVRDWCSIFQLGANNSFISCLPKFVAFGLKVPS